MSEQEMSETSLEREEARRYGKLKWEFWRLNHPLADRTFYVAPIPGGDQALVYLPLENMVREKSYDEATRGHNQLWSEASVDDKLLLDQMMKERGYKR